MRGGSNLTIEERGEGEHHVLSLAGELDLAAAPELDAAVERLCAAGVQELEIDLQELDFIDSTGIRSILQAKETCARHGIHFYLVPARRQPQRVFEVAGLLEVLPWRAAR